MNNKNIIRVFIYSICAGFLAICMPSCKKTDKSTTSTTGTFYMHLHTNIDTNEVDDVAALYRDSSGRHFGLSTAQFYISDIMLHNVNGSMYTIPGAIILKNIDSEQYVMGQAPVGTYDYVMFNVGLDATTNALQPTAFTTTGYISNSSMWYGTTAKGYMFMKLQGFADTTATQSGTDLVNFSYEIGGSSNLMMVTMPTRTGNPYPLYTLTANGGNNFVHIICDYGKLLSVINFKTQDSTDSYLLNPAISTAISNNIPNMFHYED